MKTNRLLIGAKWLFKQRFFRFLISGGINTLVSYACFAFFMYLIGIKEISVTLNLIVAVFFNYNMSARFVFRGKAMDWKQIIKFYAVYFITYPLNLFHLHVTVDVWGWNVYLSQLATLLYMPLISFLLQRKFVFKVH